MSQLSDWNQISDISGISTISPSSSRIDYSQSSLDHYSNAIQNTTRSINQGTNPADRVVKSLTTSEENMSRYIKANIVYQCVKEVSLNRENVLSESTANKLRALILIHELDKYMHLPSSRGNSTDDQLTLLGIMDLPSSDLDFSEKLDIKCYVETMLREKIHNMILRYEALGKNMKNLKTNEYNIRGKFLECNDTSVMQWKNKIEELASQYESDLLKYAELMNKWNKLKYEDMSQNYLEKSGHLFLQAKFAELQAKITKLSCTIRMFKETPTTVTAFKTLNDVVDEKLKMVMDEIHQKEELKKLYDNLRNTEYDQVLKAYSQLCNAIKKKKYILERLG